MQTSRDPPGQLPPPPLVVVVGLDPWEVVCVGFGPLVVVVGGAGALVGASPGKVEPRGPILILKYLTVASPWLDSMSEGFPESLEQEPLPTPGSEGLASTGKSLSSQSMLTL